MILMTTYQVHCSLYDEDLALSARDPSSSRDGHLENFFLSDRLTLINAN